MPTYVIDYPVATTPSSVARLGEFAARGECHIGAHLHPWVNPPYVEAVNTRNSYACNLGATLEAEKITALRDAIGEHFGLRPRTYKAGRYGFGSTTAETLERLNFDIDASVNPHMDFSADGGPSFDGFAPVPSTFGRTRRLLELPCTTGFAGAARGIGPALHRAASAVLAETVPGGWHPVPKRHAQQDHAHAGGKHAQRDVRADRRAGRRRDPDVRADVPQPEPEAGLHALRPVSLRNATAFLSTIDRYCDYFLGRIGGVATTPADLYDQWCKDTSI